MTLVKIFNYHIQGRLNYKRILILLPPLSDKKSDKYCTLWSCIAVVRKASPNSNTNQQWARIIATISQRYRATPRVRISTFKHSYSCGERQKLIVLLN